ncbi:hypothetical protein [Streptomyces sp. NBC_00091]|uniref:hypothetical protein n=1 Tax=Streptomyces sp. NBC_00091 TaxID=2975648 RepID=UPI00225B80F3|nr:hypothetical protein [Streptomyces sp. NBC_00091]MCX5376619.1 hypothetical protein [Streptomyces sp. NBC_00091]
MDEATRNLEALSPLREAVPAAPSPLDPGDLQKLLAALQDAVKAVLGQLPAPPPPPVTG